MEIKNGSLLIVIIAIVALPATISVIAYWVTKNPTLRPLARTMNDEAIYRGQITAAEIVAHIRWTTRRQKTFSQQELANVVQRAFRAHGVASRVVFEAVNSADPVTITYQVGRNEIGPSRINRAGDAVNNAIAVYRMYKMSVPAAR